VQDCTSKGLSVIEGNAEKDLHQFPNLSFDFVVLSQTLQAFLDPENVISELLRIGKKAVVTIPNFGYWKVRIHLLLKGTMPITKNLPNEWYNTPNLHMCTIKDFVNYCNKKNIKINNTNLSYSNLFSQVGIFVIEK
ncbi:MAG: methyltransferase domain-containing protein, partial [Pelagibacterales bacterium]|nr:methyltransferase domain-containing protein [Pelagibacterales bacterium]